MKLFCWSNFTKEFNRCYTILVIYPLASADVFLVAMRKLGHFTTTDGFKGKTPKINL